MMKVSPLSLFFLSVIADVSFAVTPVMNGLGAKVDHIFQDSAENGRHLQSTCDRLEDELETLFEQIHGYPFSCSCSGTYSISCSAKGEACCGEVCGTIKQILKYDSIGNPISESVCTSFTSGTDSFDGKSRCVDVFYSNRKPIRCEASLADTKCVACDICDDIPEIPQEVVVMTSNCNNVPGGDLVSTFCRNIDTVEEQKALTLECGDDVEFKGFSDTEDSAMSNSLNVTALLAMIFLAVPLMW